MEARSFEVHYQAYASPDALSDLDQKLLQAAVNALDGSWSPYSNFKVGAAVRMNNGAIILGSNQENAAYPMCLCAERTALAAAASQFSNQKIESIAITVKNPKQIIQNPAMPCGACRQVICENEDKHQQPIRVILRGEVGEIFIFKTGRDILPFAFSGKYL